MHARTQIRNAVIASLTGLGTTGANVFASRVYALQSSEYPCLLISTAGEDVDVTTTDGTMERVLSLTVEARVKATSGLEDSLDTIASEVETALLGTFPANVQVSEMVSVQFGLTGEGDQPFGFAAMSFRFTYFTKEALPDSIL